MGKVECCAAAEHLVESGTQVAAAGPVGFGQRRCRELDRRFAEAGESSDVGRPARDLTSIPWRSPARRIGDLQGSLILPEGVPEGVRPA